MTSTVLELAEEIDAVLTQAIWGILMSHVWRIESLYKRRHKKPLILPSGVTDIQQLCKELGKLGKVLLLEDPETKETAVMSVSLAKGKQQGYVKSNVKELLDEHGGEIAFTSFPDFYNEMFTMKWRPDCLGLTGLDQLCDVLEDIVTVEVNSSGDKVMKAVNKDSSGQEEEEEDMALLIKPEIKETYDMSLSLAQERQIGYLKFIVRELLDKYGGQIPLCCFEDFYKDTFKVEWKSHYFDLTDLDQLCHVLEDIVMVEVNSLGDKVMKPVNNGSSAREMEEVCEQTKFQGWFYHLIIHTNNIDEVLERCPVVIAISDLSRTELSSQLSQSPRVYTSFGVKNIQDLFFELAKRKKVLLLEMPETKEIYVMSFPVAESKQKGLLKYILKQYLDEYGEMPFSYFEHYNEHKVEVGWNPFDYGLTDLDQLCDVLKDIVMVGVDVRTGRKVMKPVNKDSSGEKACNLRKRKIQSSFSSCANTKWSSGKVTKTTQESCWTC